MDSKGGGGGRSSGHPGSSGRHHPYKREQEKPAALENEKAENKLYVGNLDHRVTEYHLIKMFSPYGKIRHEEYLWHTHGPRRGEPRGYGFVEYASRQEAERAKTKMNGRMAFGRPLVVRFVEEKITAHNADAPVRQTEGANASTSGGGSGAGISKSAKIAAIQSKLRMMEREGKSVNGTAGGRGGRMGNASQPSSTKQHDSK